MPVAPVGQASLATPDAFWAQVLVDMGAPITQSNIEALRAWSEHEGGGGNWNPLNTTRPEPGSTFFNHLSSGTGVQNYPSAAVGAKATADSINNGLYPSIVAAFKSGNAFGALVSGGKGPIGAQLRKWSGGAYNNVYASAGNYTSPTLGGQSTTAGASSGKAGSFGGASAGPASSSTPDPSLTAVGCQTLGASITAASKVAVVGGIPGEAQIAGFFGWITQSCVQKRLLFQGVGLLLILYGFKFMGHSEPLKIVTAPVKAVGKGAEMGAAAL
jgi:hypothetical protein